MENENEVMEDISKDKNATENDDKNKSKHLIQGEPPDGGWGWIVAISACIMMSINMMLLQVFGIIYSRFLISIEASSVTIAWMYNISVFLTNITKLFIPPLDDVFGLRKVAIGGAIFIFLSVFLSSFSTQAWHLFCSFSVLGGIGIGFNVSVCLFIVPRYFKKRRGIAMAIMMSGTSIGVAGGSVLITYLQNEFGYSEGTFILSAICLQCLPAALIFQPVSWHLKFNPNRIVTESVPPEDNRLLRQQRNIEKEPKTQAVNKIFKNLEKSIRNNLKMIKSCKAAILALEVSISQTGYSNFNMIIPFWLQSIGFSIEETSWCVSITGIMSLLARLLILFASDIKCFNVRIAYISGTIILVVSTSVLSFITNWNVIVGFVCLFGIGMGISASLFSLFIIDVMGMKDYQPTYGLYGFFRSFLSIIIGPLAGWLRDNTNFRGCMLFLSFVISVCIILFGFLMLIIRREEGRTRRQGDGDSREHSPEQRT